ncbi:MAG: gliding motility lipoprotein GldH [Lentimicrobiaceae bacterium]|nr:gliding motility lipoprotein GldH [Lentimicrobiaceae bacterium]
MKHRGYIYLIFGVVALILFSCDRNRVYDQYAFVNPDGWIPRDGKEFPVEITDTVAIYNLYINLRHTNDYPFSNIFFFVQTRFPDGQLYCDTVEYILADPTGKWTGRGLGKIKDHRFTFRKGIHLPRKGTYVFRIEQAMREKQLKGIHDVGLRLERY